MLLCAIFVFSISNHRKDSPKKWFMYVGYFFVAGENDFLLFSVQLKGKNVSLLITLVECIAT
jgi:hypothetical protein